MGQTPVGLDDMLLGIFMPMHLVMSDTGVIEGFGATIARIVPDQALLGKRFEDLFEIRSPGGAVTIGDLLSRGTDRFRLNLRSEAKIGLRGVAQRIDSDARVLMNLSFGLDLVSAVTVFGLTNRDFVATDLAMELLFLAEANSAVTRELRGLNLRLEGARLAAEEEALTDRLTGLRNRRAADRYLLRLCEMGTPFGLMHMDLDYFKKVNDTLGHAAGDHVLGLVGEILRQQTRAEDCAARIGGDEFMVILPERTQPRLLRTIAERIIAAISTPMTFAGQDIRISASVGVVRSTDHASPNPATLLADSDLSLYTAKRKGRGRAVLYGDVGDEG